MWVEVASSFEDGAKVDGTIANFLGYGIAARFIEKAGYRAATVKLKSVGFQCGLNSIVGTFGSGGVPRGIKRAEAGFALADIGDRNGVGDDVVHSVFDRLCGLGLGIKQNRVHQGQSPRILGKTARGFYLGLPHQK